MRLALPRPGFDLAWSGDLNPDVPTRSKFAPLLDRYCRTRLPDPMSDPYATRNAPSDRDPTARDRPTAA